MSDLIHAYTQREIEQAQAIDPTDPKSMRSITKNQLACAMVELMSDHKGMAECILDRGKKNDAAAKKLTEWRDYYKRLAEIRKRTLDMVLQVLEAYHAMHGAIVPPVECVVGRSHEENMREAKRQVHEANDPSCRMVLHLIDRLRDGYGCEPSSPDQQNQRSSVFGRGF